MAPTAAATLLALFDLAQADQPAGHFPLATRSSLASQLGCSAAALGSVMRELEAHGLARSEPHRLTMRGLAVATSLATKRQPQRGRHRVAA